MVTTLRALLAVVMLACFAVFGAAIAAVAVLAGVYSFHDSARLGARLMAAAAVTVFAVVTAVWKVARARPEPPRGIRVPEVRAPELWRMVTELAGAVGTRPPDEIVLIAAANAAVTEDTRLLGLIGGRRYLLIGTPLLQTFTTAEIRSVLAHELGHYSRHHTRLAELSYRGRATIEATVENLHRGIVYGLMSAYAALYRLVEAGVSRRQELEADAASVALAGSAAAASALAKLPGVQAAWETYLDEYVLFGLGSGAAPRGIAAHFPEFAAARGTVLERGETAGRPRSRWDSHPPVAARIARMRAAAPVPAPSGGTGAASSLIPALGDLLAYGDGDLFRIDGREVLPFDLYAERAARYVARTEADRLYRGAGRLAGEAQPGLHTVLYLESSGRHRDLVHAALGGAADARRAASVASDYQDLVVAAIRTAAADSGAAKWELSWAGGIRIVTATGEPFRATRIAEPLLAAGGDGSGAGDAAGRVTEARARLVAAGIDIDGARVVGTAETGAGAEVTGAVTNIVVDGRRRDVIVLSIGFVIVPACAWATQKWPVSEKRLRRQAEGPVAALIAIPGHRFVPLEAVASAEFAGWIPPRFVVTMQDGTRIRFRHGIYSRDVLGEDAFETMIGTLVGQTNVRARQAAGTAP